MAEQISGLTFVLAAETKRLTRGLGEARTAIARLDKQTRSLQTVLSGIGIGIGFYQIGRFVTDSVDKFKAFESTMAEVKAITGATDEQFKILSDDAIRLGRSTIFTAKQVGELQVAYGRLGFSVDEIKNATETTLDLAAATNIDLASAAEVAGSTLRAFGLNAVETVRVTDVMAASFNKSALEISAFRESMKFVAPVARAAGASIEETTALLAVLANNGIKGSIAGTSLRRIFSDLTRDGSPLSSRLDELAKRGLTLGEAYDEIGRVAQTALLVLSKNTDAAKDYTEALKDVEGETRRIRDIRLDTLEGDIVRLQSAWEGFIVSQNQAFSVFRLFIQELTYGFNKLVGEIAAVQTILPLLVAELSISKYGLDFFTDEYVKNLRKARQVAQEPIEESFVLRLAQQAELSAEETRKLLDIIRDINKELTPKEVGISGFNERFGDARRIEQTKAGYDKLTDSLDQYRLAELNTIFAIRESIQAGTTQREEGEKSIKFRKQQIVEVEKYIDAIKKSFPPETITGSKQLSATYEELTKKLQELNQEFDTADRYDKVRLASLGQEIIKTKELIAELDNLRNARIEKPLSRAGLSTRTPVTEVTLLPDGSFVKDLAIDLDTSKDLISSTLDGVNQRFLESQQSVENWGKTMRLQAELAAERMVDIGPLIANSLINVADAFGNAVGSAEDFGKAIVEQLANFAQQFGALLIATGIGKISFDKFKGPAMIAAGAALVALGGAVKGAINNRPNLGSSNSSSSRSGSDFSSIAFAQDTALGIRVDDMVIRGQDLYVIMSTYNRNNRSTGNG